VQEPQAQDRWCWAAVTVSVVHYYDPSNGVSQCERVDAQFGLATCCGGDGEFPPCNCDGNLEDSLSATDVLDHLEAGPTPGAVDFDALVGTIRTEINANRVLCIRFAWAAGGAHFIVIAGYGTGANPRVRIEDPLFGTSTPLLADLLAGSYQTGRDVIRPGRWTDTYFTKMP
jgi:hypothetical protein